MAVADETEEPPDLARRNYRLDSIVNDPNQPQRLIGKPDRPGRVDGYRIRGKQPRSFEPNPPGCQTVETHDHCVLERPDVAYRVLGHAVAPARRLVDIVPAARTDASDLLGGECRDPHGGVASGKN